MAQQQGPSDETTGGQEGEKKVPLGQTPASSTDSKYPRLKAAALAISLAAGHAAGFVAKSSYLSSHGVVDTSREKIPTAPTKPKSIMDRLKDITHRAIDATTNEDKLRQSYKELQQQQIEITKLKGDKEYWSYFLSISLMMFLIMNELIEHKRRKELKSENQKLKKENEELQSAVGEIMEAEGITSDPSKVRIVTQADDKFISAEDAKRLVGVVAAQQARLKKLEEAVGLAGLRIATDVPAGAAQPSDAKAQAEEDAAAQAEADQAAAEADKRSRS